MPEQIQIPPVPAGVEDANDLAYGMASAYKPVKWSDLSLHDTLKWLLEVAEAAGVILKYDWATAKITDLMTNQTRRQPVTITFYDQFGVQEQMPAHWLINMPEVSTEIVEKTFGFGQPNVANKYPGFSVRHPEMGNPVGAPWPELDSSWKRPSGTLFHPSASDSDYFVYGNPARPEEVALFWKGKGQQGFTAEDGKRYAKRRMIVGGSPFGGSPFSGPMLGDVWEFLP